MARLVQGDLFPEAQGGYLVASYEPLGPGNWRIDTLGSLLPTWGTHREPRVSTAPSGATHREPRTPTAPSGDSSFGGTKIPIPTTTKRKNSGPERSLR